MLHQNLEDQYDQIDRERLMGELFYAGVLAYHAQLEGLGGLMAAQMSAEYRTNLSVGTYGYQPWVRFVFGLPMALDAGGVHMDLDSVPSHLTTHNGSASHRIAAAQPLAMLKSILENVVPEQQFSTEDEPAEGISAVAAIAKAQAEGQRVFHITQDNLHEALAEISISAESRQDVQRAVSQFGYEAIVHESPITVPGWRGSGYILTNPETGAGSYMIDGAKNGSFSELIDRLLELASWGDGVLDVVLALIKRVPVLGFLVDLIQAFLECEGSALAVAIFFAYLVTLIGALLFMIATGVLGFLVAAAISVAMTVGLSALTTAICNGYSDVP
jgi:hypothetical protein